MSASSKWINAGGTYMKSHPYRKLCPWKSKSELAAYLVENKIHHNHGLFITNKPFGVGVRNPQGRQLSRKQENLHLRGLETSPYTLEDVLPNLRELLNEPNLILNKSAEKMATGLSIFATDEETSKKFSKCVSSSKSYYDTLYKYHVVTTLPPNNLQGSHTERFGIMVKRYLGSDVGQPVLLPEYTKNAVKRGEVIPAHVCAKLVKTGFNGGFLLEINTSSTAHNFLRIFCADKLSPILGDHLYSSRVLTLRGVPTKIDPTHLTPGTDFQKLSTEMMRNLNLLEPEHSLMVPMHVHLRSYKVRNFLRKPSEMELEAPYPDYFKWTCEQLGIHLEIEPIEPIY